MELNTILLLCAALLPALGLCVYIFIKDRVEKEPIGLLLLLFGLGAVSCFPAVIVEVIFGGIIDAIFAPFIVEVGDTVVIEGPMYYVYNLVSMFFGVALVEEGLKFLFLLLITRKNKHFNSLFDGIIYAAFVSLGFAALENVLYVVQNGWGNAVARAILSVPGHMFFAVMMGYYYSLWHMKDKARILEKNLKSTGAIDPNAPEFSSKKERMLCLVVPICFHGFYNFCCSVDSGIATLLLLGFVVFMYIYCFGKVRKMSKYDTDDTRYAGAMVLLKYPHLRNNQN